MAAAANQDATAIDPEGWFEDNEPEPPSQVGANELLFLAEPAQQPTPHSLNRITITGASLVTGWVDIAQCYQGLDKIDRMEIVYRYRNMRDLRIHSQQNIGAATISANRIDLIDVAADASLCIETEARIMYPSNGGWVLRNGPFHRSFLDGYFPLHVSLEVSYPAHTVRVLGTTPEQQPGFNVTVDEGQVNIDSWFAGSLTTEIFFASPVE